MAKLTLKARNKLPDSKFAEPGQRAYPVDTKARAANAKARAAQQVKAGNLAPSAAATIKARANRKLYGARIGPSKLPPTGR